MRSLILIALFALSFGVQANDMDRAPAAFTTPSGRAIFVDFTNAEYKIKYDVAARTAIAQSKITFNATSVGQPVFDLVVDATAAKLDGQTVAIETISLPDNASKARMIASVVSIGEHTLEITAPITELVEWDGVGVRSAFWTTDLDDRGYLEQYLPANMEFDRVPMTFKIEVVGATKPQRVYANGVVQVLGNNKFEIAFPEYFTSSSLFFHMLPEGVMSEKSFTFRSIDGRDLPVVIYKKPGIFGGDDAALERLKTSTIAVMNELESDYGPFLHPSVTIYNAGSGGMEYCGATMTDTGALGHELTHSYFARGIMPANGNAGWIDEAIASWRDNRYPRSTSISGTANMAGRPGYTRFTDYAAYSYGARFMAYLDGKFAAQGGLKSYLRKLVDEKAFTPYFTEDFIAWGEGHYRTDLAAEFRRVYGGSSLKQVDHPVHQKMTIKELRDML